MAKITIKVDNERITIQLRRNMADGMTAEQAAETVAEQYNPAPVAEYIRPILVREARSIAYQTERRTERSTVFRRHTGGLTKAERDKISLVTFRDGHGNRVEWGKATVDDHKARIAWNDTRRDLLDRDSQRHAAAIKLIESEDAECLDDIPDWHERITEICEHWVDDPAEHEALDQPDQPEHDQ